MMGGYTAGGLGCSSADEELESATLWRSTISPRSTAINTSTRRRSWSSDMWRIKL